jgi:hypothetical protein
MIRKLLLIIGIFIGISSFAQTKISIDSVQYYLGKYVTVCAKVYGVKELTKINFINLGAAYPNSLLTIVVYPDAKKNFKAGLTEYDGKEICVTGKIVMYEAKASYQIKVEGEKQLVIQK